MMNNSDPARVPQEQEAGAGNAGKTGKKERIIKRLLHAVTHNWGWKLGSLALAISLWGILITQDTSLPRTKVISDVRVAITNSAALRSNGLVVVNGLDDTPSGIRPVQSLPVSSRCFRNP